MNNIKEGNKKALNPIINSIQNKESEFWTEEIVDQLMFLNYQRDIGDDFQDVRDQVEYETQMAYEQKQIAYEELDEARKTNSYNKIN